jgi:hypothetical protein
MDEWGGYDGLGTHLPDDYPHAPTHLSSSGYLEIVACCIGISYVVLFQRDLLFMFVVANQSFTKPMFVLFTLSASLFSHLKKELPNDVNVIKTDLRQYDAHFNTWLDFMLAYYRQGELFDILYLRICFSQIFK